MLYANLSPLVYMSDFRINYNFNCIRHIERFPEAQAAFEVNAELYRVPYPSITPDFDVFSSFVCDKFMREDKGLTKKDR